MPLGKCLICVGRREHMALKWKPSLSSNCGSSQGTGAGGRSHQPDGAAGAAQVLSDFVIRGMKSLTKKNTVLFSSASAKLYWWLTVGVKNSSAHQILHVLFRILSPCSM